ncbi:tetratricopeptide repeat protein [Planctomicrobium piriforme]|uniref:tetratricopeptide repeat protein n=1 Tax=Planctomicrobium piriforme TaxID=1576369 RepID=UPI000B864118|nr:hypothetical protein [Planctomicrobium piriforme]
MTPVQAAEPVLQFLEGLRERRYFDTALLYLDQVSAQKNLPPEVKQILPYERGQTLLQSAKELQNLDAQRKQLDAAQAAFEEFVKANPNHELAGRANTARGQILLEKARVDIWDGDKPSNAGNRDNFRQSARKAIASARKIFEEARNQHQAAWKKFPAYIPEEQKAERAARDEAEELFIRSQLDLAQCTYWEAQTYDKGSKERKKLLQDSAFAFEAIHQQYRSQIGGLFARIWQGKCFEEQGDAEGIRIALGIYGEILEHDGSTATMRNLKDRALRFRMICLNTPERHDPQLVIQEAEAWLKDARDRSRTDVGLGIQWELCRAQESLGADRNTPESARKNYLTQALNRARAINRFPGELKNPSSALIQKIMVQLNRDPSDPKDFDTAYGNGGVLYEQVSGLGAQVRKLQAEGKQKESVAAYESMQANAAELTRMYDLALKLAGPNSDPLMVNTARVRLAYGYLLQHRDFEAAVVAEDQMLRYGEQNPEFAKEAGFLVLAAFDHAYSEAPAGQRDFEEKQVIAAADRLCEKWPDSDRANDARNTVAKIYWNNNDLLTAASWWLKIPKGTAQYADAQVRAGKAYWRQYVTEAGKPEAERPNAEELNKWKQAAVDHLTVGLDEAEKNLPDDAPFPDDLVGAKLTLVNIRNLDGVYQQKDGKGPLGALDLLQKDPHAVLKEVDVPKGQARPKDASKAKSRQMASFAYQQLLRAYVGTKNLDEARKARTKLEEVAAGGDEAALTQVFVDFGRELERELDRLRASGDKKRLDDVRAGFEAFLNELFQRKEGQTIYSLLWIGETFTSLADGSSDNPAKAEDFYKKAAEAYQAIVDNTANDPNFATAQQLVACKLRMVNCLRNQKDFAKADQVITDVLKSNPNAPDAQFEAAQLYQSWAQAGGGDSAEKFNVSLYGKKEPLHIWGWTYTAQSLQQALFRQKEERIEKLHFDARYNLADAEKLYGLSLSDSKESKLHLERALGNINSFQRVSKRWPDEEYQRFNTLYKSVLSDLGQPVVDLPRELASNEPKPEPTPDAEKTPGGETPAADRAATPVAAKPVEKEESGSILVPILLLVVVVGGLGGFLWIQNKNSKRPRVALETGEEASFTPAPAMAGAAAAPAAFGEGPPLARHSGGGHGSGHSAAPAGPAFPSFGEESPAAAPAPRPKPVAKPAAKPTVAAPAKPAPVAKAAPVAKPVAAAPVAKPAPAAPPVKSAAEAPVLPKPAAPKPVAPVAKPAAGPAAAPGKIPVAPAAKAAPSAAAPKPVAPAPAPKAVAPVKATPVAKPAPAPKPVDAPFPPPKPQPTASQPKPAPKPAGGDSPFPFGNPLPSPPKSTKPPQDNPFV